MKHSRKGFSFIEILISCAILIVLATVGVTYSDNMKDKSNNSKVKTELSTLENSFTLYYDDIKAPILPSGNQKYYKIDSSYAHDASDAFGVSGFATDTTIPKKYINFLPIDPKSNQYYAFASTLSGGLFEVAGILKLNNTYQALVHGNFPGNQNIQNLIREYNGPNFVFNNSTNTLPYNPEERILTAKIRNFSGSVLINNHEYSAQDLIELELFEGDTIGVNAGGFAEIFFSDGSQSTLGDNEVESQLTLANMRFPEEYNLTTQIKLALNVGSLWTKASKLSEKSQFEIYTIDSVAAVRGTIFGVRKESGNNTNTVVIEGEVEVKNIPEQIQNTTITEIINNGFSQDGNTESQIITVEKGGVASGNNLDSLQIIEKIPEGVKTKILNDAGNIHSNIILKIKTFDKESKKLTLNNTKTLKTATNILLNDDFLPNTYVDSEDIIISLKKGINTIQLCDAISCTAPLTINTDNQVSYTENQISINKCNGLYIEESCGENLMGEGWEVTHFAPFDRAGDLNLYKKENTFIEAVSQGILNNTSNFPDFCHTALSSIISSFCEIGSMKGIFIDSDGNIQTTGANNLTNDFLKYDLTNEGISGDHIIEFQVKGDDLLRSGPENYYLFHTPIIELFQNNQKLKLREGGQVKIDLNSSSFLPNSDYIIQVKREAGKIYLSIKDTEINGSGGTSDFLTGSLSIGNKGANSQWNGVIDYVKIYRKSE